MIKVPSVTKGRLMIPVMGAYSFISFEASSEMRTLMRASAAFAAAMSLAVSASRYCFSEATFFDRSSRFLLNASSASRNCASDALQPGTVGVKIEFFFC